MKGNFNDSSRKNSIFSIVVWLVLYIAVHLLYGYATNTLIWTPTELTNIDTGYEILSILLVTLIAIHIVSLFFHEIEHSFFVEGGVMRRFFPLIKVIIISLLWSIGGFYILDSLNINTTSILTGAGIGGVLLAIASRDIITNLFGSLSILLSRTFEIGETIRIRIKPAVLYEGLVEEITLNYTKITNISGEVIFVPNRLIYTETIENISRRRFFDYTYRIPFPKKSNPKDIQMRMKIIEGKISTYDPLEILYDTEIPNANDLVYKLTVMLPEENKEFDTDMRNFLMEYIFIDNSEHREKE